MAYQTLYRRYRPQTFGDMRGQEHVVRALRNAVREDRVGHAYLLSGPRGTGKTTAARVLAKVLNCETPTDGEPCGECTSCVSIEQGTSFDLHELDAASNNKVDDMRDLLAKVALGTPGRTKVYLLDEVHMLTSGAENALLKTLEEPPDHVVFVLATTEPHKVVPTIRSRTQHLELSLIPADQMIELVHEIAADADLEVSDDAVAHVVRAGGGSARDTLSALDQVVAAGGVANEDTSSTQLLEAVASSDSALALSSIEAATSRGIDPRRVGEEFINNLRSVFLVKMGAPPARLSEPDRALADDYAARMAPGLITRALEAVGSSLVDMRQAPDPRIDLEVAFVRLCTPSNDTSVDGLVARIEQLEAALASGVAPATAPTPNAEAPSPPPQTSSSGHGVSEAQSAPPAPTPAPGEATATEPADAMPRGGGRPADLARAALRPRSDGARAGGARPAKPAAAPAPQRRAGGPPPPPSMTAEQQMDSAPVTPTPTPSEPQTPTSEPVAAPETAPQPASAVGPEAEPASAPPTSSGTVTFEMIRDGWSQLVDGQSTAARARYRSGTVSALVDNRVQYVVGSDMELNRCEKFRPQIEAALSQTFGLPLTLELAVGTTESNGPSTQAQRPQPPHESEVDIHDLTDAEEGNATAADRIAEVFPGAEIIEQEN